MWSKVIFFTKEYQMLEPGDSVLIGLSGGADSVCLARYLLAQREELALKLYAVHVNHMLRDEEAGRDEAFVREFCRQNQIFLTVVKRDIRSESREKRCSEEEAGRMARYECFEEYAKEYGCGKIAVAHHANDMAETILFRMMRGTGLSGIAGILPVNGKIIRPFLCLRREEILEILGKLRQPYVEDSTNACEEYSRNFIRRKILPEMSEVNAGALGHICGLGSKVQELLAWLEPEMDAVYRRSVRCDGETLFLPEAAFLPMAPFVKKEVLRRLLFEAAGRRKDISSVHVEQLLSLMNKREGKRQDYPYGLRAIRIRDGIVLKKAFGGEPGTAGKSVASWQEDGSGLADMKPGIEPVYPDFSGDGAAIYLPDKKIQVFFRIFSWNSRKIIKRDCVKYFDYDKIECKICLRTRRAGDYFVMDKEGRTKKLNRYFIDTKIPVSDRDGRLLLADGSHIMWIVGGRISEFYKVSEETKRVLEVSVREEDEKNGGC